MRFKRIIVFHLGGSIMMSGGLIPSIKVNISQLTQGLDGGHVVMFACQVWRSSLEIFVPIGDGGLDGY